MRQARHSHGGIITNGSEKDSAKQPQPCGSTLIGKAVSVIVLLLVVWLLFNGRISYAVAGCSKGTSQCVTGIAVALGIVDVYDNKGRCTGTGCNF